MYTIVFFLLRYTFFLVWCCSFCIYIYIFRCILSAFLFLRVSPSFSILLTSYVSPSFSLSLYPPLLIHFLFLPSVQCPSGLGEKSNQCGVKVYFLALSTLPLHCLLHSSPTLVCFLSYPAFSPSLPPFESYNPLA